MKQIARRFGRLSRAEYGSAVTLFGLASAALFAIACSGAIEQPSSGASHQGASAGEGDGEASSAPGGEGDTCNMHSYCTRFDGLPRDEDAGPHTDASAGPSAACHLVGGDNPVMCVWFEVAQSMNCSCSGVAPWDVAAAAPPDTAALAQMWRDRCNGKCVPIPPDGGP